MMVIAWSAVSPLRLRPITRRTVQLCSAKRCRSHFLHRLSVRCIASIASTPRSIEVLPLTVVQRIASGNIIRGPSCVVRELVENSLDAGAKRITVEINTKSKSVTVRDDGRGIPADQLDRALLCNATSKLRDVAGLDSITTLGFRGQGLWAVAATASNGFNLMSRTEDADIGTSTKEGVIPMAVGTVITASGVEPWNEVRSVRKWLEDTALSQRGISFSLLMDGKQKWRCDPASSAKVALAQLMNHGVEDIREACVDLQGGNGSIRVAVGVPGLLTARNPRWLIVAVNGRIVKMPTVASAIRDALRLGSQRYPVAFIECNLDPNLVNWNVSPIKEEIALRSYTLDRDVSDTAVRALREALQWNPSTVVYDGSLMKLVAASAPAKVEPSDEEDFASVGWSNFKIVSQVLGTYILVESDAGITLVEQHVADERALYERFRDSWRSSFRRLDEPIRIPDDMPTENVFNLTSLGFDVDDGWVRSAPAAVVDLGEEQLLALGNDRHTVESACSKLSCTNAVRNGQPLTKAKMKKIVEALGKCQDTATCPHGRRIVVPLSAGALATLFGRRGDSAARSRAEVHHTDCPDCS